MIRYNAMGQEYNLVPVNGLESTRIHTGKKSILVKHPIDKINQAWYDWTMKGHYIQVAFSFLTPDEREFLLTGITPEEWSELFNEAPE